MPTLFTRLRHLWLGLRLLPIWITSPQKRKLLAEMRKVSGQLPVLLKKPIPQAMIELEKLRGERPFPLPPETQTRQLADLAALLDRRSPLGLCLRRSLLRYRYLHELDVPVTVQFGAKFTPGESANAKKIAGHAWLVLGERPYHEYDENWQGYTVMLRWPTEEESADFAD
ncbi:lasso peptide biosynthesis protein [Candidatus Leptofilum sp.]|uniref:lasso peptide biosynthesis protein n=1 Tax=Candidatus Leptofilum sp. TaxID=3241576 RepID=UPI003B5C34B7